MKSFPQAIRELSCLPFPDFVLSRALSAGAAESFNVPDGAKFVILSSTGDFYANANAAATVPGDVTDGTAAELNPTMRSLTGVSAISVIAPADCVVTAAFYS